MNWSSECAGALAGIWLLMSAVGASAALGEPAASVQVDQMAMGGMRRVAQLGMVQVHTVVSEDGSVLRQYVGPNGRVVAVAWNTRYKPRLDQLLGEHFAAYEDASRAASNGKGIVRRATVQRGDLVVESASHLGNYRGLAYLRSGLPNGVVVDAAR